jgi:iron complex outermembrane receptor protein
MRYTFAILFLLLVAPFAWGQTNLSGKITNPERKTIAGAYLTVRGFNLERSTTSASDGSFQFLGLPQGQPFEIAVTADGYQHFKRKLSSNTAASLQITLFPLSPISLREVPVAATRTGEKSGMARTLVVKKDLEALNTGQDLPYLLALTPSAVVTSDAGNGIGYTGIRIRGSDPTRINVTVNGIPLNDSESQLVYWVNMPDFASSVENIEVTRGAGSSTNGAGAFGASVNILTQDLRNDSYATLTTGAGSFNTLRNNVGFGTGLLANKFIVEGRLSRIISEGFIDRASSDLKSFYMTGQYRGKKSTLRANIFSGRENTYQSWYGVPESRINNDVQGMLDYSVRNGLTDAETANLLNSGLSYNYYTYENQVDNYGQDHYQLHYSRELPNNHILQIALHATKGGGYYEEYKSGQDLESYGIAPVIVGSDTLNESDLIRRRWLDNWFYGTTFSIRGRIREKLNYTWGGAVNRYDGDHFGEITWARIAGNSETGQRYYDNNAVKDDYNTYLKGEYKLRETVLLYSDIQYRRVDYRFTGPDEDGTPAPQNVQLNFINPKAGVTWDVNDKLRTYASFAIARKEPNRNDYTETTTRSRPRPETLRDWEAGLQYKDYRWTGGINVYYMDYIDQLVLTGQVNDVGSYTRTNIDKSYRTGIELEGGWKISKKISLSGNATFCDNRIREFTEFTDAYDADFNYIGQKGIAYTNSQIAFSPAITSTLQLSFTPSQTTECRLIGRYVGEQFMDNTGSTNSVMPAFSVLDLRASWTPEIKGLKSLRCELLINNLLDAVYVSNGYTFGYNVGSQRIRENFFYPQAGLNFMAQLSLAF